MIAVGGLLWALWWGLFGAYVQEHGYVEPESGRACATDQECAYTGIVSYADSDGVRREAAWQVSSEREYAEVLGAEVDFWLDPADLRTAHLGAAPWCDNPVLGVAVMVGGLGLALVGVLLLRRQGEVESFYKVRISVMRWGKR